MKNLWILRGCPGCGKSTTAKQLKKLPDSAHYEADMYHYDDEGNYNWKPENVSKAYTWCQSQVCLAMEKGLGNVIVSNTSTTEKELKPYKLLAEKYGYMVHYLIKENRHDGENIHNVPDHVLVNMMNRFQVVL